MKKVIWLAMLLAGAVHAQGMDWVDFKKEAEQAQRQADEKRRLDDVLDRQKKLTACQETREFKFYEVSEAVSGGIDAIAQAKDELKQQHKISAVSGVRDLYVERQIGERIVIAQDDIREAWPKYKGMGGKASSPAKVPRGINDPCDQFYERRVFAP